MINIKFTKSNNIAKTELSKLSDIIAKAAPESMFKGKGNRVSIDTAAKTATLYTDSPKEPGAKAIVNAKLTFDNEHNLQTIDYVSAHDKSQTYSWVDSPLNELYLDSNATAPLPPQPRSEWAQHQDLIDNIANLLLDSDDDGTTYSDPDPDDDDTDISTCPDGYLTTDDINAEFVYGSQHILHYSVKAIYQYLEDNNITHTALFSLPQLSALDLKPGVGTSPDELYVVMEKDNSEKPLNEFPPFFTVAIAYELLSRKNI